MNNDLDNYIRIEYGMTLDEFKRIKWDLNSIKVKKHTPKKADLTQLNIYFKSEFGMNYKDYRSIIPDEKLKSKKRILHK